MLSDCVPSGFRVARSSLDSHASAGTTLAADAVLPSIEGLRWVTVA